MCKGAVFPDALLHEDKYKILMTQKHRTLQVKECLQEITDGISTTREYKKNLLCLTQQR